MRTGFFLESDKMREFLKRDILQYGTVTQLKNDVRMGRRKQRRPNFCVNKFLHHKNQTSYSQGG